LRIIFPTSAFAAESLLNIWWFGDVNTNRVISGGGAVRLAS
jgi:hypothetical protein